MRLTAQEEYGLRCLLQVARGEDKAMTTPEIADNFTYLTNRHAFKTGVSIRAIRDTQVAASAATYTFPSIAAYLAAANGSATKGYSSFSTEFCGQHTGNEHTCVRNDDCSIRSLWIAVDRAVQRALQTTKLSDLLRSEPEMKAWIASQPEAFPLRTVS